MDQRVPKFPSTDARYDCCVDAAMHVIEGRWKCTILCLLLKNGSMRFSELERIIGQVTSRILTKQLSELVDDGMISRDVDASGKVKVYYSLTKKGESIMPVLIELAKWGANYELSKVITVDSIVGNLDCDMACARSVKLA